MARGWNRNNAMGLSHEDAGVRINSPHCPVTHGNHTRMTVETYRRLCLAKRAPDRWACVKCHGGQNPPAELELTDMAALLEAGTKNQTIEMEVNAMSVLGECNLCGKKGNIRSVHNKMACGTCEHIWRAVKTRPDMVLELMVDAKGDPWIRDMLPKQIRVDDSTDQKIVEKIRSTHGLADDTDIAAFVDNLVADANYNQKLMETGRTALDESNRRLHAAEQVIENTRIAFGIEDKDTSIVDAVTKVAQRLRDIREAIGADPKDDLLEAVQRTMRDMSALESNEPWDKTAEILGIDKRGGWEELPEKVKQLVDELQRRRDDSGSPCFTCDKLADVLDVSGETKEARDEKIFDNVTSLKVDNELLRERIELIASKVAPHEVISDGDFLHGAIIVDTDRTSTLLDLAIDVIAGKVTGIDATRIQALR